MEAPGSADLRLLILVLRAAKQDQDAVSSMLHCGKRLVVDTECWFRELPYREAASFVKDEAMRRAVSRELPGLEEADPELLVKASQITGDDILRHYRDDYLKHQTERLPDELLRQHWSDLADVARTICSNLNKLLTAHMAEGAVFGNAVDGGVIIYDPKHSIEITIDERTPEWLKEDPSELTSVDKLIAMRLLQHLKEEFTEFSEINDFEDLTPEEVTGSQIKTMRMVATRNIFYDSHCDWCRT